MGYEAVQSLLDRALPDAERQEIIDIVTSWPGVSGAHDLARGSQGRLALFRFIWKWKIICRSFRRILWLTVEQAILQRFPGSDVIIHQDPVQSFREGRKFELV